MQHAAAASAPTTQTLSRQVAAGFHLVRLPFARSEEVFLTLPARQGEAPAQLFQRLYQFAEANPRLHFVRQGVFGVLGDPMSDHAPAYHLNGTEWPITWVQEGNGGGQPVAGIQVHALGGLEVQPVRLAGQTVGAVFEDDAARYCVLSGLQPADARARREAQAQATLERMDQALAAVGMSFAHVFRTWFYLDDILDWYGEFNRVRNAFFRQRGVYDGVVPASTGVGGRNAAGTALVADLLALVPKHPAVRCLAVPSPRQCPALDYGSSFSRAVEVSLPGQRRLYVSGTASILPDGRTAHVGDAAAQVELTMEVVAAILAARGMTWNDAVRGIGYFKHMEDAPVFDRWCLARGLASVPVILAKNDICRDDLLFEIELDAVRLA